MTSRNSLAGIQRCGWAALIFFLAIAPSIGFGQANAPAATPASLPPEAQAAMKKGIIAAQQQDYSLALRFFQDARKLAPDAPEVFYNLGLAESKIPGRELRAITWFGAYLSANPTSPNAAAVKEQMDVLVVKSQNNLSRLIKSAQDAASQVSGQHRDSYLGQVPVLWAKAGDIIAALKTVDVLESDIYKGSALKDIAETQAKDGDFDGAQKTADLIQRGNYKSEAQVLIAKAQIKSGNVTGAQTTLAAALKTADLIEGDGSDLDKGSALLQIASAQANAGDIAGAQMTAALIQYEYYKIPGQAVVAKAQAANGDIAGAKRTLAAALKIADLTKDPFDKSAGLAAIAEAQTASGDIAGARKTLAAALKTVDLIKGMIPEYSKGGAWSDIAQAQAKSGDIVGAQRTADRISSDSPRHFNPALAVIAEAQAKAGDIAGAQKTANRIKDAFAKGDVQQLIATAKAKISTTKVPSSSPQVSVWLNKLDDSNPANDCPLNTAPFLDLAGHFKSLPPSGKPWEVFDGFQQTARSIAWAHNVISQMLKQLAAK